MSETRVVSLTVTAAAVVVSALIAIALCLIVALALVGDSSSYGDERATGKQVIEKRGFTEVTFLNAKTDGEHALDDSIFAYDVKYRSCPIRLTYNSFSGNITYVAGGGQTNVSETISDVSVKSLDLLKRANFKNCTG